MFYPDDPYIDLVMEIYHEFLDYCELMNFVDIKASHIYDEKYDSIVTGLIKERINNDLEFSIQKDIILSSMCELCVDVKKKYGDSYLWRIGIQDVDDEKYVFLTFRRIRTKEEIEKDKKNETIDLKLLHKLLNNKKKL